jgi:carbon monoxide dehydrogenase subunit G
MQLKQRFVVAHSRELVWTFFGRMEDVTPCMPGAALTEAPAGNQAKFKLNVKLGPISAAFVGDAELERDAPNYRGVIRGAARDSRGDSRVKGVVNYTLTPANGSATAVDIDVDFALTGRLAQFSRGGIVNDLAGRLTAEFARNLETALNAEVAPRAAQAAAGAATSTPASSEATTPKSSAQPKPAAQELNAGRLLFSVIRDRIIALLRSIFRRR